MLNLLNEHLSLACVEGDASTTGTSSSCTTTSMDVGLSFLGRLDLDDQVNVGDVKSARSDIGSDKDSELAFFKALHRDFTLVLSDITMHDLNVLLDLIGKQK